MMEILEDQGQDLSQGQEANRGDTYLLEVIDRVLDKGQVIEGWSSVRVLGLELLTLDFTSYVASIAKYLDYAEAHIEMTEETADRFDKSDAEPEQLPR